jgi:uncharacterized Tic20 family protein
METLTPPTSAASSSVRTWCVLSHATALLGGGLPALGHLIGPLIIWLVKKDESPEVEAHAKESLNFQISMMIYAAALAVIVFVLLFVIVGFLLIPLFGILYLADIVLVIIASIKASEGVLFRYPLTIRFLK